MVDYLDRRKGGIGSLRSSSNCQRGSTILLVAINEQIYPFNEHMTISYQLPDPLRPSTCAYLRLFFVAMRGNDLPRIRHIFGHSALHELVRRNMLQ
jgi:hypothetical protein